MIMPDEKVKRRQGRVKDSGQRKREPAGGLASLFYRYMHSMHLMSAVRRPHLSPFLSRPPRETTMTVPPVCRDPKCQTSRSRFPLAKRSCSQPSHAPRPFRSRRCTDSSPGSLPQASAATRSPCKQQSWPLSPSAPPPAPPAQAAGVRQRQRRAAPARQRRSCGARHAAAAAAAAHAWWPVAEQSLCGQCWM